MNKKLKMTSLLFMAFLLLNYSCVNQKKEKEDAEKDSLQNLNKIDLKTKYKLPSPVELYIFLTEQKVKYNKSSLNPIENGNKYTTTISKALNFGIYASDLAYCAVFEKPQDTYQYYKVSKKLADDLALAEGFNETIAKRIEANLNNLDSLFEITSDAYWDACTYLEAQEKNDLLGIITVGSWIESVHIAFNSVDKFSTNNDIVVRIAEQQMLLDNLLDYLKNLKKKDAQIEDLMRKLIDIQQSFDKLYDNPPDIIIKKDQFKEIQTKVTNLRNTFIS